MSWWSRLTNVFTAGRLERELDEELQFHRDERIRELMAGGLSREAATSAVARRFGNPLLLREQSRDVKLFPWLDSLIRDVRQGVRALIKHCAVTGASVLSLALALGACVAAFSLVDALILRPLPVRQPERLVYLAFPTDNPERPEGDTFNDPLFVRVRDASREHAALFAMSTQVVRPTIFSDSGGEKERLRTQYLSGDAFEQLGVKPAAGRLIGIQDDDQPGAHPVAVLSHAFWLRRFGGDPSVLGRWLTLEGRQLEIVGVAERTFTGVEPGRPTDLWLPYTMYNPRAFGNPQFGWFRIFGRLKDGVQVEQAQSVAHAAFSSFRREYAPRLFVGPDRSPERIARFVNTPLYLRSAANGPSPLRQQFERALWIMGAIAALVLLIAGSNVANLFLARTAAREREMALRLSIGATRQRLVQQMLVESALVAGAACLLGLLFAEFAGPAVVQTLSSPDDPVSLDLRNDWRLLTFAGVLALVTTALFGIVPALRASSVAPLTALKSGGGRSSGRAGVMRPFVAAQVAFGLMVLFVGSLLVLSFSRLTRVDPGFATSDVLILSLETLERADQKQQRTALFQVLEHLANVPGVQAVSSADVNLLGRAWTHNFRVPGTEHETLEATVAPVTDGFLETMRIPVRAGRAFLRRDLDPEGATAVIVNEAFASRYFGRQPAVGRTLDTRFGDDNSPAAHEIVGVVADTRYDLRKPAVPTIYIPLQLRTSGRVHARVTGDPLTIAPRLREEVHAASPIFRVTSIVSQASLVDRTLLRERLLAVLSGFFALVGLILAAVGLYGVLSYSVVQRTREIGIRVALGARQRRVMQTILADVGAATLVGIACGLAGALYLSRFVQALLFEVTPLDFWSLTLPLGTLLAAGLVAAAHPALRAARLNPVDALRYE